VHILHVFPSFQLGGSQRRFAALANHFGARYQHTIVSLDGCTDATDLILPQIPHQILSLARPARFLSSLAAYNCIRAVAPNLLVTHNWGSMNWVVANLFCRVRHFHIEDGFGPEEINKQLWRRVLFRRLILNMSSTVILPSRTLVKLAAEIWKIAAKRIVYIPNGIPCARFSASLNAQSKAKFRGTGPIIGTVATLRKEKALGRLISAFRDLRSETPLRLVIVGDGPERCALEALVDSLGISHSVTFTGGLSQPETAIGAFNIFAISSDTEQMPLSVLEAMAAGLPIAATDVGDIRSMVAPDNLPFVVSKHGDALTGALRSLLSAPSHAHSIGAANHARAVAEFDERVMFARYGEIFSS